MVDIIDACEQVSEASVTPRHETIKWHILLE